MASPIDTLDPPADGPYDGVTAYARTKRAEVVLSGLWAAPFPDGALLVRPAAALAVGRADGAWPMIHPAHAGRGRGCYICGKRKERRGSGSTACEEVAQ